MMKEKAAPELLKLLERLTRIPEPARIVQEFINTLSSLFPDLTHEPSSKHPGPERPSENLPTIALIAGDHDFGQLTLPTSAGHRDREAVDQFAAAGRLLALILDHRIRERGNQWQECPDQATPNDDGPGLAELESFFQSGLDLFCIADVNGRFLRLNPEWEKILGYPLAELEGRLFLELVHPEDREATRRVMADVIGQKPVRNFINRYICRDGSYRWLEWRAHLHGRMIYGTARDVSERKSIEEKLQTQHVTLTAIFESVPNLLLLVDRGGRVRNINRAGATMTGRTREELLGLLGGEIFHCVNSFGTLGCGRARVCENCPVRTRVSHTYNTGESLYDQEGTLDIHGPEGAILKRFLSISTTKIQVENTDMVLVTIVDVTERKQAETDRVILERQLRQAQKMEAIGTLAGGIAHDFNNILAAILGYTELSLLEVPPQSNLGNNLNQILQASQRAKNLVRQILDFSRRTETELSPVDLASIVLESVKLLRSSLPATIEIRTDLADVPLTIRGDATQIHQILINLGTNAAHSMREKGGILGLSLAQLKGDSREAEGLYELSSGPYALLTVSDTGHGMSQPVLDRVFEPFFTTKAPGEGTGMGLSVVFGIVHQHGGLIKVRSETGRGTTFLVYLPLIATEPAPLQPLAEGQLPRGRERILWVDDEPALAAWGKRALTSLGYTVTSLTSSLVAWNTFQDRPQEFDLVITDMTMPGLTGLELASKLREYRPNLPVIICSGYSQEVTTDTARIAGFNRYMDKPLILKDVARAIREVLDSGR